MRTCNVDTLKKVKKAQKRRQQSFAPGHTVQSINKFYSKGQCHDKMCKYIFQYSSFINCQPLHVKPARMDLGRTYRIIDVRIEKYDAHVVVFLK